MEETKPRFHYAWLIMVGCCFLQAGGLGGVLDAAGVFFAPVCMDLGVGQGDLAFYLTLYFLATIVAMPLVGNMLPRFNVRILLSVAFILVVAGVACMGMYDQVWQWYISGLVFGLAGSFIFIVPAPILIANWFHKRTGIVMGITMCFSGIGGAILAPIFTALIQSFGWRMSYGIAAIILAVLVLPWTLFVLRLHPRDMGLKPYGWTDEDEAALKTRESEQRPTVSGVSAKRAVRSIAFVCMFLFSGLIAYFAGFNSNLPRFALSIGYEPMFGATMLSAVMVGNVADKLLMGYLNDRIGVHLTVLIQLAMVIIGFLGFLFFSESPTLLLAAAFFFGVQNSLVSVSTPLLIRRIFGERDFTQIYTYARIGTGLIGCLGPVTVGYLFDWSGSFDYAFMLGIGICVVGFVVIRISGRTQKHLVWEDS